jgi:hypothetical protein
LPISSEITSSLNRVFIQVIGKVKNKICDDITRLHPQVIAKKHIDCEVNVVVGNFMKQYSSKQPKQGFIVKN